MRIGIVSDTHGLLRPEAITALQGSDVILHAGDLGKIEILEALEKIAPVHAIRGNVDGHPSMAHIPETLQVELGGLNFYLIHNIRELNFDPGKENIDVVLYGHSHKPELHEKNGVQYLNPGSAGPRRFNLPIVLALLNTEEGLQKVEFVELIG